MITKETAEVLYMVHFTEHGFYAKDQPEYMWSFTHDVAQANTYKTIEGARSRLEWGQRVNYGTGHIIPHTVKTVYDAHSPLVLEPRPVPEQPQPKPCKQKGCTELAATSTDRYCFAHLR